ncbi:hypothetical protein M2139_001040 [Enterococcus sp. PF1-24]|uniref:restriction endonuclease subunit S n=1 Tax=unclassified Enterococcus TaxID=2608891 RepID=UPI0024762331|nr:MULTISPECIES: restriction endonuclease subunit S [unclassified Enterococcus]MDH6364055.1 hypothetical protein [Enterococcus sp. PFB1-1]MDH6401156.1 hypothetical protein [Enterococcus sp. PF1-24]
MIGLKLSNFVDFNSGTPQFRIQEAIQNDAPSYKFYSQDDLENDLYAEFSNSQQEKQVKTFDKVSLLNVGDVVFSLISGKATIVSEGNAGKLYTQNYVLLNKFKEILPQYLVYFINEDISIKRQFQTGMQGSITMKYTVKQLRELKITHLPNKTEQKIIGDIYFKQLKLEMLKKRVAKNETLIRLKQLQEVGNK